MIPIATLASVNRREEDVSSIVYKIKVHMSHFFDGGGFERRQAAAM